MLSFDFVLLDEFRFGMRPGKSGEVADNIWAESVIVSGFRVVQPCCKDALVFLYETV